MLKRSDLTPDERLIYMPTWEKIALMLFAIALPFIGSIDQILW